MIYLLVILAVLVLFGLVYALLSTMELIPGQSSGASGERGSQPFRFPQASQVRELPEGCLFALIVAGVLWFLAWGVVLILVLNFLRSPFG